MKNACFDKPRLTDFDYQEIFWLINDIIKEFPIKELNIQDQSSDDAMFYSCTRQWMAHITNWNNLLAQWEQDDWMAKRLWLEYCKIVSSAKTTWATLQSSLDQFLEQGLISWYSRTWTIEAMKSAIDSGRFIFTGSQNWDWTYVKNNHIYRLRTDKRTLGHAFCIIGYNLTWFIAINSYGENNGVFEIPYNLVNTLFTRYAISDFEDTDRILLFKQNIMQKNIQKAIDSWITSGKNQDKPATRWEVMTMMWALITLIENKIWKL